jgi:hypothetical protein
MQMDVQTEGQARPKYYSSILCNIFFFNGRIIHRDTGLIVNFLKLITASGP